MSHHNPASVTGASSAGSQSSEASGVATVALLPTPDSAFELREARVYGPASDEVRVRVAACGVCHTDAVARQMVPMPCVLGHEGAGVVEECGSAVKDLRAGDRVMLTYPWCGECGACRAGKPHACSQHFALAFAGHRRDGSRPVRIGDQPVSSAYFQQSSFSTLAVAPARSAVRIESDISLELAAALGCGISTGAGAVVNTLSAGPGSSLVVFGAGAVGLAAVMAARIVDAATVVAVDVNPGRLQMAAELGASAVLDARDPDLGARLTAILPGGSSLVLDTSGAPGAWMSGLEILAPDGTFAFVTLPQPLADFTFKPLPLFVRAASMKAVLQGSAVSRRFVPQMLEWHAAGRFPFDRLVTTYPFTEINRAFADAAAGTTIKPVLKM